MDLTPRPASASFTETVQFVLPNDANPLGFVLGGTVMHLVDLTAAAAALRHARVPMVTAAVDGLQFLHPVKVGDLLILRARVTGTFRTSLEVEVEVFSEGTMTGERTLTSHAFLTFASFERVPIRPLLLESDEDRARSAAAEARRAERLKRRAHS